MNNVPHDPAALFSARFYLRQAYLKIKELRQDDPTIRVVVNELDAMCVDITTEIETAEPRLPLPKQSPKAIKPQSLARERYESAWRQKESLR